MEKQKQDRQDLERLACEGVESEVLRPSLLKDLIERKIQESETPF